MRSSFLSLESVCAEFTLNLNLKSNTQPPLSRKPSLRRCGLCVSCVCVSSKRPQRHLHSRAARPEEGAGAVVDGREDSSSPVFARGLSEETLFHNQGLCSSA